VYFFCPYYCERVCLFVLVVIDTKETNAFVSIGNPIRKKKKKKKKMRRQKRDSSRSNEDNCKKEYYFYCYCFGGG
tara:strand:+ start:409 stop:633 length:225 start_codon:yes stop_codon:yes gene_type:complete